MDKLINVVNWLVANNHLVAWFIAAVTGAAYRTYKQRHNDNNVTKDFEFIADKAKTYAHVVNGNDNIPTNEVKPAIIKLTREAVDEYNANTKTRTINVTDQDISHATDVAIDYYNKNFGGFTEAKPTKLNDADIEQALQPETASVATSNAQVASNVPSSASSATNTSELADALKDAHVANIVKQVLAAERGDK